MKSSCGTRSTELTREWLFFYTLAILEAKWSRIAQCAPANKAVASVAGFLLIITVRHNPADFPKSISLTARIRWRNFFGLMI